MAVAGYPIAGIVSHRKNGVLRFYDADESHYVGIRSNANVDSDIEYSLPAAPPAVNGYVLSATTAGVMEWVANSTTLADDSVTNLKLANMASSRIKGRISPGTGDPEDLTDDEVRTILSVPRFDTPSGEVNIFPYWDDGTGSVVFDNATNYKSRLGITSGGTSGLAGWTDDSQTFATSDDTPHGEVFAASALGSTVFEIFISAWKSGGAAYGTGFAARLVGTCIGRGGAEAVVGIVIFETEEYDNGLSLTVASNVSIVAVAGDPSIDILCTGLAATDIEWRICWRAMSSAAG